MILWYAIFVVAQTATPIAAPSPPTGFSEAIKTIKRSILPIVCIKVDGTTAEILSVQGTGFFAAPDGTFVTAGHVIESILNHQKQSECPNSAFYLPQGGGWTSDILEKATFDSDFYLFVASACRKNADIDVAVCRSPREISAGHNIAPVTFSPTRQQDGTQIAFTGFPLQYEIPISSVGTISGYGGSRNDNQGPRDIMIDKTAWPGASGSPIYLIDGTVIGILLQRGMGAGAGTAYGRPGGFIQAFLAERPQN